MTSTSGADIVAGLGGNDTMSGLGGMPAERLPQLSYPFVGQVGPYGGAVARDSFRWLASHGLLPTKKARTAVADAEPGLLIAATAPRATYEGTRVVCDWQSWLFLCDDSLCDDTDDSATPGQLANQMSRFLHILEDPSTAATDTPLERSLADLMARLRPLCTSAQWGRFTGTTSTYFLAQTWEAGQRELGRPAPVHFYVHMRRHNSAVLTCMCLADVIAGYRITEDEYWCADITRLRNLACDIVCVANDLISYDRETTLSHPVMSLPVVLAHQHGLDGETAFQRAIALHNDLVASYLEHEARIYAGRPTGTSAFGLRDLSPY